MSANSVFISHATRNDSRVEELRRHLELLEVQVWADHQNLTAGQFLAKEIRSKIEACDAFVAFLTQDAMNSAWVQEEIKHALKSKKTVIALLTPEVKIPALKPLFRKEPVAILLTEGPAAITNVLPQILAATVLGPVVRHLFAGRALPAVIAGGVSLFVAAAALSWVPREAPAAASGDRGGLA